MDPKKDLPSGPFDIDMTPFREFMHQMDNFFNKSFQQINSYFDLQPFTAEVKETEENVVVTAELPNHERDQITLEIIGNSLRIAVQDARNQESDQNEYLNKKAFFQQRERIITLPSPIPENETKTTFRDGLLTITIPKTNTDRKFLDIEEE